MDEDLNSSAEQVAATVETVVASEIEAANERAENAEAVVSAVIEGAMETEQVRQMMDLKDEVAKCQTQISSLPEMIQNQIRETLEPLISGLAEANASVLADGLQNLRVEIEPRLNPLSPISEASTPVETEVVPVTEIQAEEIPPVIEEESVTAPVERKKKHRFL